MAQTGYTPILLYSSSTGSQAPSASNLTNSTLGSELAINITDGKLFYKDNANAVQVIAWKTTPTTAGGTGLTSYTAGDLLYYATGTTLTKLAIGAAGNWLGSSGTAPQWNAPAALTKTDDTNVTLTLGGSASTALLNAASLTLGWTGTLAVSRGGTGTGTAGITAFNNITGYTATGATGTTSTNLVFSTSPSITTPTLNGAVRVLNATGGTTAANYLYIEGSTANNSNYPGLEFRGGTLYQAGRAPMINLANAGLGLSISAGYLNATYTAQYGIYMDSSIGLQLLSSTSGAPSARLTVAAGGDVTVNTGNLVIGTSGKGIDFSATPGTGSSELFSDYEEGSFTVTIKGGTTDPTTPVTGTGYYTKIGRIVNVLFSLDLFNTTGVSGQMQYAGLPFTSQASLPRTTGGVIYNSRGGGGVLLAFLEPNATLLRTVDSVGNAVSYASAGANTYVSFSMTYIAA